MKDTDKHANAARPRDSERREDELTLDKETIRNLDPKPDTDEVKGGKGNVSFTTEEPFSTAC